MPNTFPRILTVAGIQYMYEAVRGKMLSIPKVYLKAGTHRRTVTNEYLRLEDGQPSMTVGEGILRNATIMSITAHTESAHTWTIKIFRKGSPTPLVILPIVSAIMGENLSLDADVPASSVLLFKAEGTNIPFPRVTIELAWKL
jgi:hypothetical protein